MSVVYITEQIFFVEIETAKLHSTTLTRHHDSPKQQIKEIVNLPQPAPTDQLPTQRDSVKTILEPVSCHRIKESVDSLCWDDIPYLLHTPNSSRTSSVLKEIMRTHGSRTRAQMQFTTKALKCSALYTVVYCHKTYSVLCCMQEERQGQKSSN